MYELCLSEVCFYLGSALSYQMSTKREPNTDTHLSQTRLQDPVCKDIFSKGVDSLVVVTNIKCSKPKGKTACKPFAGSEAIIACNTFPRLWRQAFLPSGTASGTATSSTRPPGSSRHVAYRLALHAVNESLTIAEAATDHVIDIVREHWSQGYYYSFQGALRPLRP